MRRLQSFITISGRQSIGILLSVAVAFCACGARTGLDPLPGEGGRTRDAAEEPGDGGETDGGSGLCSMYEGPVGSCDAGHDAGPIQRCVENAGFETTCAMYFPPVWGCCVVEPPNGLNTCFYPASALPTDRCGDY
jgi:hypothetical protein